MDEKRPTRTTEDGRVLTLRVGENGPGAYYPAMPEAAAFVIPSNEGERTGIAPEDEAAYMAQREAILAYRDGSK